MHGSFPYYWHWVALATIILWGMVFRVRLAWRHHVAACLAVAWAAALFSWSVSLEPARGGVSGRVFSARTHQPLYRARVFMPGGDMWVRTDVDGKFSLHGVPVGKRVRITARARGYETSYDEVKVDEAKETVGVLFRMTPRTPTFNIYNSQRVFTPSEQPEINLSGVMTTDIYVSVYRLDAKRDRAQVMSAAGRPLLAERVAKERGAAFETHFTADLDQDGDFNGQVHLPELDPGLYVVRANVEGGKLVRQGWFLVTDLAMVTRRTSHEIVAYAQDFSSGRPVPGVVLEFCAEDGDRVVKRATTGSDGTFRWNEPGSRALTLVARHKTSYAYSRLSAGYSGEGAPACRVYLYTDRPIYRPGHDVHIRGMARRDQDRKYTIPAGQTVRIRVEDTQGAAVAQKTATVSEFGGFETTVTLPLHGPLGDYSVVVDLFGTSTRASFKVAEYRKPEFKVELTPAKAHYISGERVRVKVDARYFFGSPVTPAKVKYSVYESYYHYDRTFFYDVDGDIAAPEHYGGMTSEGTLRLADDGTAWIEFTPEKSTHDRDFWIDVEVEDQSHRAVSASTDVLVTLGDYYLEGRTDRWGYKPGERVEFDVSAREYEGDRPRANTRVHAALQRLDYQEKTDKDGYSRYERREEEVWSQDGVTNSKGRLTWSVTPPSDGSYQLVLSSRDPRGNTITTTMWFYVSGDESARVYGGRDVTLLLDKQKYAPGSAAHVVVTSRWKDAFVLLSVDGRRIHQYKVVRLRGRAASITLPVRPEYFPNVTVTALAIHNKQLVSDERPLVVDTAEHGLDIKIIPDKTVYEPGQDVHCRVRVADKRGRPVQAEFSLGVVDSAIYALAPDSTQKIYDFFYGAEASSVRTEYSFAPDYSGGRNKEDDPRVRRNFKDTAWWAPMLKTGVDGTADVTFALPDNLTAWRFTVRAITMDHRVGEATREVTARKPLLVRLEVPRFMVERDKIELSAVVHNETGRTQDVNVEMVTQGVALVGGPQTHKIPPHGVHRFGWTVEATLAGEAKIQVSARGQGAGDAMELTFPVIAHGVPQLQTAAGEADPTAAWDVSVPPQTDPRDTHLTVYLSPSLAAAAMQGLDYLAAYPYGCVEQTMSSFIPDIVVSRALRDINMPNAELQKKLPDMVAKGLDRLYDMQHVDGGWGWWKDDATQPYLTAYVVGGLFQARRAGYTVRDDVYKRGVAALKKLAAADSGEFQEASGEVRQRTLWNVKAYELRVLSTMGEDVHGAALAVERHTEELNVYTQALLAETLWRAGEKERARVLLERIRELADETQTTCHWDTKTVTYSWVDNPVEATAAVLRAIVLIDPQSLQVSRTVRWLVAYRKGASWDSTKDTAAVIDVLTDVLLMHGAELGARFEARVQVNGHDAARVPVDGPLLGAGGVVEIPSSLLHDGENRVEVSRNGSGTLYWSAQLKSFARTEKIPAEDKGFSITRSYAVVTARKDEKGRLFSEPVPVAADAAVPLGSRVRVTITVKNTKLYPYVIIEDKLIPGCELVESESERNLGGRFWWIGREVHDDRLSVFVTRLEPGEHRLTYEVRTEAPGIYHVRPAEAYLMYTPEVRGHSTESSFEIGSQGAQP